MQIPRRFLIGIMMVAAGCAAAAHAQPECTTPVCQTAMRFLDAYAAGNEAAVMSTLSAGPLHVYGSDLNEFAADRDGVKRIFDADQKLWKSTASWGAVSNVSTVTAENISTLFFDRIFKVGGREIPVRFAMVWVKEGDTWKLTQSSNTVPTTGQSAEQLLQAATKPVK
jgi:hypothetical protein